MSERHLTAEEVDRYWTRRLPDDQMLAIEEHYLDCGDCLSRIRDVEVLVQGLRGVSSSTRTAVDWRLGLAAGLALVCVGLLLERDHLRGQVRELEGARARFAAPTPRPSSPAEGPWSAPLLRAVQRSSELQVLSPPPSARLAWLNFEALEAGPPGAALSVSLLDADGKAVVRMGRLTSSPEGRIALPVAAELLTAGDYVAELRAGGEAPLRIPFSVRR